MQLELVAEDIELKGAFETLSETSLEWIIWRVLPQSAAELLRTLHYKPNVTKSDKRSYGKDFAELIRHRCIRYTSKRPIKVEVCRTRVLAMANETRRRTNAFVASEEAALGIYH